jgi:hypothetical protein
MATHAILDLGCSAGRLLDDPGRRAADECAIHQRTRRQARCMGVRQEQKNGAVRNAADCFGRKLTTSSAGMDAAAALASAILRAKIFINPKNGGAGGIRTLDRALQPYNGLANRRLQPLGHSSVAADMPEAGASRKQQISNRLIPKRIKSSACRDLAQG